MQNPWLDLPSQAPYILPQDKQRIEHYHDYANLRLDTLPEQAIGGLDRAEVVFLLLNPGFDEKDISVNLALPTFIKSNRLNATDPYGSPFYYFNGGLERTGGYEWWARVLGPLTRAGASETMLRNKIMAVEYFPYHSKRYKNLPVVPSQAYGFNLVGEAIKRQKTIVIMRGKRLWLKAVPGLAEYSYLEIRNPRNVVISSNNLVGGETSFQTIKNLIIGA